MTRKSITLPWSEVSLKYSRRSGTYADEIDTACVKLIGITLMTVLLQLERQLKTASMLKLIHNTMANVMNNMTQFFVVKHPMGEACYEVVDGKCRLLCGYTDIQHSLGWAHDTWEGESPLEEVLSPDRFRAVTMLDPTIVGKHYLDSDKLAVIYSEARERIPQGFDSEESILGEIIFALGPWHKSAYRRDKVDIACKWLQAEAHKKWLVDYLRRRMQSILYYNSEDRKIYYRGLNDLYIVKKWLRDPQPETMPRLSTLAY